MTASASTGTVGRSRAAYADITERLNPTVEVYPPSMPIVPMNIGHDLNRQLELPA